MKKLLILVLMPFITWAQEVRIVSNEVMVCDLTYGEDCLLHKSRTELILPEDATMVFIKNKVTTVSGLCVVAFSINIKLTTTLDRAITQNPCYVSLNL